MIVIFVSLCHKTHRAPKERLNAIIEASVNQGNVLKDTQLGDLSDDVGQNLADSREYTHDIAAFFFNGNCLHQPVYTPAIERVLLQADGRCVTDSASYATERDAKTPALLRLCRLGRDL